MDLTDINQTIAELEVGKTSFQTCEKLAALLTVRDHLTAKEEKPKMTVYSRLSEESEFMRAVNGAPLEKVFAVLDEHMNAIQEVAPKEYLSVCRKISETK